MRQVAGGTLVVGDILPEPETRPRTNAWTAEVEYGQLAICTPPRM